MELKVGMTFTGREQCFTGRVEILVIDEPNNRLRVGLTKKNKTFTSNWNEDCNSQHTIWGFERGDYFVKNFTDYPQDLQRSAEQQCNIADVVGQSEQLFCPEHEPKVRYDWEKGNCLTCAKKLEAK